MYPKQGPCHILSYNILTNILRNLQRQYNGDLDTDFVMYILGCSSGTNVYDCLLNEPF